METARMKKMTKEKFFYQLRNWKAHWRAAYLGSYVTIEGAIAKAIAGDSFEGRARAYGVLDAVVLRKDGSEVDLGCLGKRVVTTAFVNYLRDDLANAAGGADVSTFKYHGCGTGTTAEAIGDTALVTECTTALNPDSTRAVGTQVNSTTKQYQSVGTLTFDATAAVAEHGLFSAASAGTLMDRTVFTAINVASGDSIQFTYTLTISDGG
jgi:hypothetical protein